MLRKYFITILLFAVLGVCRGQTARVDSLKTKVAISKSNTEKLLLLQALCRLSSAMPADTLRLYSEQALQLALQEKDQTKIWEAEYIRAFSLQQRSFTDSSLLVCNRLLQEIKDLGKNFSIYHEVLGLKANCLTKQNKIKEATGIVYQMLASAEQYKDVDGQINAYVLLTVVRGQLNNFDDPNATDVYLTQCITWYRKAISLFKDSSYYKRYDKVLANLGMTYFQLPKSNYDSAFYYINLALYFAKEQNQLRIIASCLGAKGNIFYEQKKWDSAEYYYQQEAAFDKQIGDPERIAVSFSSLRNIYREKKEYKKALSYDIMEKDYCIANHILIDVGQYADLAQDYKSLGDYKAYGATLETLVSIKDSLYQANSAASLAEMQTKYETQKKETIILQQKYELTKQNYLLYGTVALALLSLLVARIIFVQYHKKQQLKIQLMHAEEQHLLTQAIAVAKENERKRIAADLHDNIGAQLSYIRNNINFVLDAPQKMSEADEKHFLGMVNDTAKTAIIDLRETIWALNKDTVTFLEFADKLKMYLKHHLDNQRVVQLQINETITGNMQLPSSEAIHIFRIMQEAAGNSVKHAAASILQLSITGTEHSYALLLADNGKGFDKTAIYGDHYGLENMQKRAAEIEAVLQIESMPNEGTTIVLKKEISAKL